MNKSESNGRIRQVAIVLASVDATTARQLLGQLPAAQARLVRQQMATLQNVSPAERSAAVKMLAQLKRQTGSAAVATARSTRNVSSESSPAEALLSNVPNSIDSVEISGIYSQFDDRTSPSRSPLDRSASRNATANDTEFMPIQSRSEYPFQSPNLTPAWQQWSGEELARLLMNERPTLIAAVLLQAPAELGSVILQAIPVSTATSVLAALPQLHTTDPSVLQEIYGQLNQRLADFQRQSSPENAGMAKLHAILSRVSSENRQRLHQELSIAEPLLAHSVGAPSSFTVGNSVTSSSNSKLLPVAEKHREGETQPALPFSNFTYNSNDPIPESLSFDSFESLIGLSLEELALVLRSVDPNTVLLAACGASHAMRARIEQLVDPKELKRLRDRIKSLRSSHVRDKQTAQDKIVKSARALFQQGRIASLANLSVLAAA